MGTLFRAERTFLGFASEKEDVVQELPLSFHSPRDTMLHYPIDERIPAVKLRKLFSKNNQEATWRQSKQTSMKPQKTIDKTTAGHSFRNRRSKSMLEENHVKTARDFSPNRNPYPLLKKTASSVSIANSRFPSEDTMHLRPLQKSSISNSLPTKMNLTSLDIPLDKTKKGPSPKTPNLPRIPATPSLTVGSNLDDDEDDDEEDLEKEFEEEERNAEREVNADWLLAEKLREQRRMFQRRKNALLIKRGRP